MHKKKVFNQSRGEKNIFLRTWFWWSGRIVHKNTFWTTPDVKKNFFNDLILVVWKYAQMHKNTFSTTSDNKKKSILRTWFLWPGNASKHVFNHSRGEKNNFLRTWFWCSGNASKHVFNHYRRWKFIF